MVLSQQDLNAIVNKHNEYRANYNSPPLNYDPLLSEFSQQRANNIVNTGHFAHEADCPYGECQ
jgi:uncharacterized protein YkwD